MSTLSSSPSPWLTERRRLALETASTSPLPRRGLALWRYTDPNVFDRSVEQAAGSSPEPTLVNDLKRQMQENQLSALAIEHGSGQVEVWLGPEAKAAGARLLSLAGAIAETQEQVEPYLYQLINDHFGKFESLNGAHWNEGLFLFVPENVHLAAPIQLLRIAPTSGTSFPRLLGIVGKQSSLTIIDEYVGGSDDAKAASLSNGVVELFGNDGSQTRYVSLQQTATGTNSYLSHRARIGRDATMLTVPLVFGGNVAKQNFGVLLSGTGAESNMIGVLFGAGYQHFDNHTLHHHVTGKTKSNIDFKVVLRDRALSAYTGLIRIDQHAKVCEAYQENRNLLLTPGTRAETIPELEILNEDVSCTHGATVGPIDPLQVFYLNCRGIDTAEATRMIVAGYIESTFGLLPEQLRERINAIVAKRLATM